VGGGGGRIVHVVAHAVVAQGIAEKQQREL
jgi:hypothetical protein